MKILLISISCPPKSDPESIQVGRYLKYLVQSEHSIEVLTSTNPTLYMETDEYLKKYLKGVSKVHYKKLIENRYLNFIIRKIFPSLLQYPDPKWSFFCFSHPNLKKPDLIYSRSYPLSSTLMALKLKKKWNVPWILHLSDPWAISYDGTSPATQFNKRSRKWNLKKEHACFEKADKISFTSSKTLDLYKVQYPQFQQKFMLSPNVFDGERKNSQPVVFTDKLNIVYTGGFGEKRDPDFYLNAIEQFLSKELDAKGKVNFLFTGPMTRENHLKFKRYSNIKEIKHLGTISYEDMITHQFNAHVLVNIDSDIKDPKHSVFFPSKLLEYFAAARRILAICNKHSVTYSVIKDSGGDCIEFNDSETILTILSTYWEKYRQKDKGFFQLNSIGNQYDAYLNSMQLLEEMEQLVE